MREVRLEPTSSLPLTCTRGGTCCHGHVVRVNPWEVARLAAAAGEDVAAFRAAFVSACGTRLRFDGPPNARGGAACRLYAADVPGCSRHSARPLGCRLFPLARARGGPSGVGAAQGDARYLYRGERFPCLAGCPEVVRGPHLTVSDYLAGQDVGAAEAAHDAYLEVVASLGDGALVLLIDSGLAATGDRRTLAAWRRLATAAPEAWHTGETADWPRWRDRLLSPGQPFEPEPGGFVARHAAALQVAAQTAFGALATADALHQAAVTMMALALLLAETLGADRAHLGETWIRTARHHGAR